MNIRRRFSRPQQNRVGVLLLLCAAALSVNGFSRTPADGVGASAIRHAARSIADLLRSSPCDFLSLIRGEDGLAVIEQLVERCRSSVSAASIQFGDVGKRSTTRRRR